SASCSVPDRILASSASSSTQLASFHYTDAKPSVDPIEEAFLNTLLGLVHIALAITGVLIAMRAANLTRRLDALVFAGASIIAALLATDLSWTIWEHVATLQYLAYP
ncbi:MAG TPA: hypothetical protein VJX68_15815, partial [Candidatus Binatus sp.]|uniref:hypothetical protein n=1 Tax=Candidatus Binatus sp. TaxID=2811406 RepID=UPI002B4AA537